MYKQINNKKLILWRDCPIDVEIGLFESISNKINNQLVFLCNNDFEQERKTCNWNSSSIKNSKTIILNDDNVDKLINEYKDEIHIFSGITGKNGQHIRKLLKVKKDLKFFIIAERPNIYGNFVMKTWGRLTRYIYYKIHSIKYKKNILGFFAMGETGKKIYTKLGFDNSKIFPFMYTLKLHDEQLLLKKVTKPIKMLYIGRFYDETKGTDILRNVFDKISDDSNIQLDLVGGYGPDAKKMIEWSKTKNNVHFIGAWDQNDVYSNMKNYDVCIVPSRYDGWNLTPNQAIDAGIGVLISDNATSDELVRYSGNGKVFKNGNEDELLNLIKYVSDNPNVINDWKEKSIKFKKYISNDLIGDYFLSVINYCLNNYKGKVLKAPWEIKK